MFGDCLLVPAAAIKTGYAWSAGQGVTGPLNNKRPSGRLGQSIPARGWSILPRVMHFLHLRYSPLTFFIRPLDHGVFACDRQTNKRNSRIKGVTANFNQQNKQLRYDVRCIYTFLFLCLLIVTSPHLDTDKQDEQIPVADFPFTRVGYGHLCI